MTTADADGNVATWNWESRTLIQSVPPRSADAPIIDELGFPTGDEVLFGIDVRGPFLLDAATLRRLTARDNLPPSVLAFMIDLLRQNLVFPFGTETSPRVVDLKLDAGVWAAAGVGKHNGSNKFWVGVWPSRSPNGTPIAQPKLVYDKHRWQVRSLDLAPALGLAVSGDKFGEVHVWKLDSGEQVHRLRPQGKSVYDAAFDRSSSRIVYGTRPYDADRWGRNSYGEASRVLDLAKRSILPAQGQKPVDAIQESPILGQDQLQVKRFGDDAGLSMVKSRGGQLVSQYDLTSGRMPTAYSFINKQVLGIRQPALVGDNIGMLAVWDTDSDELRRAYIGHEGMVTGISVSDDGRMLLSGSTDRTIRLWSLENLKPTGTFDFKYENATVTSVPPGTTAAQADVRVGDRIETIDGKTLKDVMELKLIGDFNYRPGQVVPVTMSRDSQTYTFDMQMAAGYDYSEPIMSVYVGDDDRWIVWTPQGYYDAAPGAEDLIGWHVNRGPDKSARYFEVGQFREQLYRPDIIDRILGGQSTEDAVREANQQRDQLSEVDLRSPSDLALNHPPQVEILVPTMGVDLSDPRVTIESEITSLNGLPIREVTLLVNGVVMETFLPESQAETVMTIRHPATLEPGMNEIQVVATNTVSKGFDSRRVKVAASATTAERPVKLVVLAVGNDASTSAGTDAQRFAQMITPQAGGRLYREVAKKVLVNQQATRDSVQDGMQWVVDQTDPGDTVMIYLAGEAFVDSSQNFYVGTFDTDRTRPRATAVSWREFIKTMQVDLPACKRVVFLDLDPDQQAISRGQRNPLLDLAAPELGTVFFSSTALQQQLPTLTDGKGLFATKALQMVLGDPTADVLPNPPDGLLTYKETSTSWTKKVRDLSQGLLSPVAFAPEASRQTNLLQLAP
ncbi:MAG: PDZ domain-containing protein, partial [Planctomycetota bacterium]